MSNNAEEYRKQGMIFNEVKRNIPFPVMGSMLTRSNIESDVLTVTYDDKWDIHNIDTVFIKNSKEQHEYRLVKV